jgi:hypothetical protein
MRTRKKVAALVVAIVVSLTLAGCVQQSPHVIPTSAPSTTPVFASDAAALAAATKAYVAYLAVSDQVANDGGADSDRFDSVVTKDWLPKELASAGALVSSKRKQQGSTSAVEIKLQQRSQKGHTALVSIYACLDLSHVQYVDTDTGLNPSDPLSSLVPVEVDLSSSTTASKLLVERNTPWQGSDFCSQS